MTQQVEIAVPDLGLEGTPILLSSWLASLGSEVVANDRIVELAAGDVTVDLPAPCSGRLIELAVEEDEEVAVGQCLAVIAVESAE